MSSRDHRLDAANSLPEQWVSSSNVATLRLCDIADRKLNVRVHDASPRGGLQRSVMKELLRQGSRALFGSSNRASRLRLSAAVFSGQAQLGTMVDAHAAISDALHERAVAKMPSSFADGGDMGALIARKDWRASALGAMEGWPAALTRSVRLCLDSRFPFAIAWGPQRTQLYNDAFLPICGGKHPAALGQDMRTCWASAWPVFGPSFDRALSGTGSFVQDGRLFLDRTGILEETFFSFSFSPLREDDGEIAGVLLTVIETTQKMLEARRAALLRDLMTSGASAASAREALVLAMRTLDEAPFDVPFAFVYGIDAAGNEAELVAQTRSTPERYCPGNVDLRAKRARWPRW
jgi:hypothetical protein